MFQVYIVTLSGMTDRYACASYEDALDLLSERMENGVGIIRGSIWKDARVLVRAYGAGYGPTDC